MSILAFDHALLLHRDLESAARAARRLGFRTTPVGFHGQGLGTANVTVMMPDRETYFEVLAVTEPTPRNSTKRAALDLRESHLYGLAFKGDARAAHARFSELGVEAGDPLDFVRPVALPDGEASAQFAIAQMKDGALPPFYAFVCQHFTPEVVWRADFLDHPNSVTGVTGAWCATEDLDEIESAWAALFPDATTRRGGWVEIEAGRARIRFLDPGAWASEFGSAPSGSGTRALALEFSIGSRRALEAFLQESGLAFTADKNRVRVADDMGFGAAAIFTGG